MPRCAAAHDDETSGFYQLRHDAEQTAQGDGLADVRMAVQAGRLRAVEE